MACGPGWLLDFVKFYFIPVWLCLIYGCFCTTVAELSSYDRGCMLCRSKNIYCMAFFRKSLLTSDLDSIIITLDW